MFLEQVEINSHIEEIESTNISLELMSERVNNIESCLDDSSIDTEMLRL